MSNPRSTTRRSVCQVAAALIGGLAGVTTTCGATGGDDPADRHRQRTRRLARRDATERFDVYPGIVDRIVDGTFVVILLESDGRVVDEVVERRDALPPLSASDRGIVVLEGGAVRCVIPVSNGNR